MPRKPVEINPECGRRLKSILKKHGFTQAGLADKIGYKPQHISHVIQGKKRLTPDMARGIVEKVFPNVLVDYLLCKTDFETIADKEAHSKKVWEENFKAGLLYDKAFRLFIDGIEALCGYGLHSQGTDLLIGDYIAVSDSTGKKVGAIPQESFQKLQSEVENYASYLIQRIIKDEMVPMPGKGKEGIENG
uniref:HTH cro/C1-type domain-containing protein n=1 Tax=uncultured prokaryote TaxID=198431 RepID=A0A0H5Q7T3_9ZZZZ|nr:hypothetical protein [uncultured prokaryote]